MTSISIHTEISLPDDKIIEPKSGADDKLNVAKIVISKQVFYRVKNIVRKGETSCYQHSLLFPQCFQQASSSGSSNIGICALQSQHTGMGVMAWGGGEGVAYGQYRL